MSEIIKASLDGIKTLTDMETAIGTPIQTPSGVTVIPVSKVSIGLATGGLDLGAKRITGNQNFGGGSGSGISITPIAFLTVNSNSDVNLIPLSASPQTSWDHALTVLEHSPELIKKIKETLT